MKLLVFVAKFSRSGRSFYWFEFRSNVTEAPVATGASGSSKPVGYCGIAAFHCVPKLMRPGRISQSPTTHKGQAGTGVLNAGERAALSYGNGHDAVSGTGGLPVGLRSAVHALAVQEGHQG
jgi:hypothetical protein